MWRAPRLLIVIAVACSSPSSNPPTPTVAPAVPASSPPDGYDPESLGALTFPVSEGTPEARAHFARGLLALHSFWYDEATRQFTAAMTADPTMRMAYWGAAMSRCKLLWGDDDLTAARQILASMPDPDNLPPREQAWVLAAIELLRPGDVRSSRQRFAAAMEQLYAQFPDDESATFLAAALLAATRPEDPDDIIVRARAAGLALAVYQHNPKHPGAAHYAIHAFDTLALAPLALPLAREYARIAPAAFHARHMPAHIFSRLGMWTDAVASCQAAWDASVAAARREKLSADHYDFHSLNWLIEINFERGRRKDADAALALFAKAVRDGLGHQQRSLYASQVASYMMRTGEWSRVDELLAPLATPAVEEPGEPTPARAGQPQGHCASEAPVSSTALLEHKSVLDTRARAAAMQHDVATTKRLLADIDDLGAKLRPFLTATQPKEAVAKLDAAHARHRAMLLARANGNARALVKLLRESSRDAELEVGGESILGGFLLHEELADLLMELGQSRDASVEYALALATHPARAHSLLGAARAAVRSGDEPAARTAYHQLLTVWAMADPGTDGLAEAESTMRK